MSLYTLTFGITLLLALLSCTTQQSADSADSDISIEYPDGGLQLIQTTPKMTKCKTRYTNENSVEIQQLKIQLASKNKEIHKLQQKIISYEIRDKLAGLPMITVGRKNFYVFHELKYWHEARQHCRGLGLDLASVESKEENSAITSYINKRFDVWVGGTDEEKEGTWKWISTGHEFTYNAWGSDKYPGYPKRDVTINCMYIWYEDGRWYNGRTCSSGQQMAFVCQ